MINNRLVVVNGDDIVFRAELDAIEKWKKSLPLSGFVVNDTKTSIHASLFTLNSKLFRCTAKRVRKVWHLIPKGIFKKIDTNKKSDHLAAHAAVVRENVKGCPGKLRARVRRALASVKKAAYKCTSAKRLAGCSMREYDEWPRVWKLAERIKGWECAFCPLRERMSGVKLEKIRKSDATDEEVADSPYVAAEARFAKASREIVCESNDRNISAYEWRQAQYFLYQKMPDYRRRDEEFVWIRERRVVDRDLEFELYT